MAMRAIMKKIISPKTRFTEGLRRVPRCFGSTTTAIEDRRDYLNNEAVVCDLERILKDGKRTGYELEWDSRNGIYHSERDQRWENWVYSNHASWKEKNEEEQKRDLDMYWKDYLQHKGIDISNHRPLLSMKHIQYYNPSSTGVSKSKRGEIVEFIIGSPERGCISLNRLVFDCACPVLPRQTVNGLLCITTPRDDAFLIYNPFTGEKSPWIDIINVDHLSKRTHVAFGYDQQTDEHKVICISGSNEYRYNEIIWKRPKDQVVDVFTVGKNTWRRVDATPPISITHEASVYVDGCLYWRFRETENYSGIYGEEDKLEQIMRFDIVTEKFRVIPIPDFVTHGDKFSQTVELIEVDGRIAVLTRHMLIWIFHEEADGNIKWTNDIIDVPDEWNGKPGISIEALTGTNLIFLHSEEWNSIFYYNRNTMESLRFPLSPDCGPYTWFRTVQL